MAALILASAAQTRNEPVKRLSLGGVKLAVIDSPLEPPVVENKNKIDCFMPQQRYPCISLSSYNYVLIAVVVAACIA
jgi:hypothetical protein